MTASQIMATRDWVRTFSGAIVAALTITGTANPVTSDALENAKRALEAELRDRFGGKSRADIQADPVLAIYHDYYKGFGQRYHVAMQIESVAIKGKAIPGRAALVEAMFMAELATGILTAVHDADALSGEVRVIATTGEEHYTRYDGVDETCKRGDMAIRDDAGILTSIIQGPTTLARVSPETTHALFCVYAPAGIGESAVRHHVELIRSYVQLIEPAAGIGERTMLIA